MKKDGIKSLFNEQVAEMLTEDTLAAIEKAFDDKVQLNVEAALRKQDEVYAEKLQLLLKHTDKDYTNKLKRVAESIDTNNVKKLKKVIGHYEKVVNEDATEFKKTLVESISIFLETYIDQTIPTDSIEKAVQNNTAHKVLLGLRNVLAVDSTVMKESVREAFKDGKQQIDKANADLAAALHEKALIAEQFEEMQKTIILEKKTAGMPSKKKEYLINMLKDKSVQFINENFDYSAKLVDKKNDKERKILKEAAITNIQTGADAPVVQPKQQDSGSMSQYLDALTNTYK